MTDRPYTVLSCCISLDGYLDDASDVRLRLSNDLDFARVDALRADCDAILVGAGTVRRDDPRLLVRDRALRSARTAAGRAPSPVRVTVTASGVLDPRSRLFVTEGAERIVYCADRVRGGLARRLGPHAAVVPVGARPSMDRVVHDLATRGVDRLLVEGGGAVLTQFLTGRLADELRLAVAPVFVGDSRAQRFVEDGRFPWASPSRAQLLEAGAVGDVAVLRYALSARCTGASAAVEVPRPLEGAGAPIPRGA